MRRRFPPTANAPKPSGNGQKTCSSAPESNTSPPNG